MRQRQLKTERGLAGWLAGWLAESTEPGGACTSVNPTRPRARPFLSLVFSQAAANEQKGACVRDQKNRTRTRTLNQICVFFRQEPNHHLVQVTDRLHISYAARSSRLNQYLPQSTLSHEAESGRVWLARRPVFCTNLVWCNCRGLPSRMTANSEVGWVS